MGFRNWIGDNSSTILTVAGIVTGIAAVIFSANAGMKTAEDLDKAREDLIDGADDITPKAKAKIFVKNFWPAVTLEAISIVSTCGSNHIRDVRSASAIAAANGAANLAIRELADYRSEVKNQLGENTDRKIRDGVAQNRVSDDFKDNDGQIYPVNAKQIGDVLCKDSITGRYFWSTPEKLHKAENWLVQETNEDMYSSLNDWYGKLGIECISDAVGDYLQWTPDDHFSLYLSTTLTPDERPCIYVEYNPYPRAERRSFGDY